MQPNHKCLQENLCNKSNMLIIRDGKFSLISSVVITNAAIKGNNCLNICE